MPRKVLKESDLYIVKNRYKNRINEFGLTFNSLKSGSVEKQMIRYQIHTFSFVTDSPSVLDIGCGLGDFYRYLTENGFSCNYTGYDIMEDYIDFCKTNYPNCDFYLQNVLENGIDNEYDNIVLSQVLNNRYKKSNNMSVMKKMITTCYNHARVAVSIDMMSSYVDFKSDELFYYSPEKLFAFAKTLTKRVIIRHDYRPFEFCLQLYKMDSPGYII